VQSVEISPGPEAIVHLRAAELRADVSAALIRECAQRGLHIEIDAENQLVVAPELTLSRYAVLALGQALSDSLTAIGSICGAPVKLSRASEKSLSPHERDLLANDASGSCGYLLVTTTEISGEIFAASSMPAL
jgi:hypothetical protein